MNRFAHLLSASKKAAKGDTEENENEKKKAAPCNDKEDGKSAKKASKKADDDADMKAGEGKEDDEDEDKDSEEGEKDEKKSDKEEEEEDEDEDKSDKKRSKKSKKASSEMNRARAIMASPYAAGQPDLAAHLAFDTDISVEAAENRMQMAALERKLDASVSRKPLTLDQRMSNVKNPDIGLDTPETRWDGANINTHPTMKVLEGMSSDQRALAVVNAAREARGEPALKSLPGKLQAGRA